ncbi:NAD(P)/FAD-dependent oxidoreductase [Eubacterium sp. 1001713B170207_170306_E7]|uniref:NAD(P)/FAD-dependent oxidoreductase n=1 Tax=Eubacterium sp. 1001713B170207_170306_E7 TaxID=2787097 RepID=UPI00189B702C|nr:NAD(P)/FAD-dependent oxidoreductase [Eubacterium sp. 1001713B170207_170306_E7]
MNDSKLFESGKIGNVTIKNRIVMPAMEVLAAGFNGEMTDGLIRYYEERAKAGVGLIVTAYASVDDVFSQSFAGAQLRVTDARHTSGMSRLARTLHKYDCRVLVQIYQAGRQAVPTAVTGKRMIAPSPIGYSLHDQVPEEMTREEIKRSVEKFVFSARILKDAMIDGVEILAAGGYLINQFLSPYSNQRTDEYGGSFENRFRFLREVVEAVRRACGADFIISVRFSADEFTEGGYGLEEGVRIARALEEIGVDCLSVNNANQESRYYIIEPIGFKPGWKSYITKAVKDAVAVPVIATNAIKMPEEAERFLAEGIMDYAAVGRANFADAHWAQKAAKGRSSDIKPCIGCLYCLDQTAAFRQSTCAVNPEAVRENEFPEHSADMTGRTIAVVGAGPAGMEAAILMKKRGARVVVFEKQDHVGGASELGSRTPDKEPLKLLAGYYAAQAEKLGIDLRLETEGTPEAIRSLNPYAVFVATGARPFIPKVDGLETVAYKTVGEALAPDFKINGKRVTVIGGGMTGCEVAEHFARMGNTVTLVEMQDKLAPEVCRDNLFTVLKNLKAQNADILMETQLLKASPGSVVVRNLRTGEEQSIGTDCLILSVGNRPDTTLYDVLRKTFDRVIPLGDTVKAGRVQAAVHSGFEKAYVLD